MAEIDITRIAGNIGAMNALNSLSNINKQLSVHQTRLSTGKRINSAADDPAGLTIATKMLSRSEGLKTALDNIGDAKNLLAVAESGMGRVNDILVQMRNKAESAASDTMGQNERAAIVTQLQAYAAQIDDIAEQTEWNGTKLINGDTTSLSFQTGAGETDVTDVDGLGNLAATGTGSLSIAKDARAVDYISSSHTGFGTMTLTTPHCPVAESMPGEVELRVMAVPGVATCDVNLVWDPPWNPANMSDEARLELGML